METLTTPPAKPRRPRFRRPAQPQRIELTPRDLEILRLVHRYRFATSRHVFALFRDNGQTFYDTFKLSRTRHASWLMASCFLSWNSSGQTARSVARE